MNKRLSGIVLILLLVDIFVLAFNIQPVKASGTIYIRADGSIDPPDAPISTFDNVTYTLTGNITSDADGIVIERDNIVVDGAGYTLQGPGTGAYYSNGIDLSSRINVTVMNTKITTFFYGIWLVSSSNNSISGNNITANGDDGVYLVSSSNNSISGNNITNNYEGLCLYPSSNYNSISGNNIKNNKGGGIWLDYSSNNSISGNNIAKDTHGIWTGSAFNNSISGNNIANNYEGIWLGSSSYNNIVGNNITTNNHAWRLEDSSNNVIYHNNFINNYYLYSIGSVNIWDDGYPSGGNYWSDYSGIDANGDGIGDTTYDIDADNQDRYPLMTPYIVPDIAVTAFVKTPLAPGYVAMINRSETIFMYDPVPMEVTVKRLDAGVINADFVVGIIRRDSTGLETVIDSEIVMLSGGDEETVSFLWDETLPIGVNYTLKAVVYPSSPFASDTNLTNNVIADPPGKDTWVVWWPSCNGPVSGVYAQWPSLGDDIIDGKDLRALVRAWPPEPCQLVCDYDNDGIIGGKDLKVLMKYWYPPVNTWPPG